MQDRNWDEMVEMFSVCVKLVPDNSLYRQFLRNSTKKKYGDNGKGAGTLEKAKLDAIRNRIKTAISSESWEEASEAIEEGFSLNPWDTQLNVDLAEVSLKLGREEIAKFAYLEAIRTDCRNRNHYLALATLQQERAEYDDAIRTWEMIARLEPQNPTVMQKIAELQRAKSIRCEWPEF